MAQTVTINIDVNDRGVATVRRVGGDFTRAAQQIERGTRESFERMNAGVGKSIDDMTTRMLRWGTVAATVFGGLAVRAVANLGIEFGRRMSSVQASTSATAEEFNALSAAAIKLGASTVFTATNAAEAMDELGLAGFKTTEILKVMPDVLNLAAAGSLDMATAAEIASQVIHQMGLSASEFTRAVDTLTFAATNSSTTVQDLGVAFSYAGNVARTMGLRVEDVSAALGTLANQGIEGERAGTGLVRIFSVMLGQVEEGEKGLGKFNLQLFDQEGRFIGLTEAMRRMQAAGMTTQDVMEAFGQRGGPTMLALLNAGSESLGKFEDALESAGGTAERIAAEKLDNLFGDIEQLKGALETLALTIFRQAEPGLRALAQSTAELARTWTEMLRGSEVIAGLERALSLLSVALGVLLVNAARRAGLALSAMTTQFIALAGGITIADAALLRQMTLMDAWVVTSTRARVAVAALAAGVGFLAYQATRAILEVTGLDSKIEQFFRNVILRQNDAPAVLQRFQESLALIDRTAAKLNSQGIDLQLDGGALDEVRKNVEQLQQIVRNGVRLNFEPAQLNPLLDALDKARGSVLEVNRLSREFGPKFAAAWKEAGEGTTTLAERIEKVKTLLGDLNKPKTGVSSVLSDEEIKRVEAATKDLEKSLLSVGRVSDASLANLEKDFARIGAIATKQQVPLDQLAAAFREDLLTIGAAADESGKRLSASLQGLVDKARAMGPVKVEFEADRDKIENLEALLDKTGLASNRAAESFIRDFARMRGAAVDANEPIESALRSMAARAFDLERQFTAAGKDVPEALRKIVAEVERFREVQIDVQRWDNLRQKMVDLTLTSQESFRQIVSGLEAMATEGTRHGIALADVVSANREEILALARGAEASGQPITGLFAQLVELARQLEAVDLKREAWTELRGELLGVGIVASDAASVLLQSFVPAIEAAKEHGLAASDVHRAHRAELESLVKAYMVAGETIPEALQQAFDESQVGVFMETLRSQAADFVLNIQESWAQFVQSSVSSMSQMVGNFLVFGGKLTDMFKNVVKQAAATAIGMLVQWGVQRLILGKISALVAAKEASVNLASGLAQTYVNSFASAAAIPFVGWAMAPGVAATNLAIASAGAGGAAAAGVGIGAAIGAGGLAMAEGGIARGPVRPLIGERGPEAVVPLRGGPARRAAQALGIGQSAPVNVTLNLGDNWEDTGVPERLIESVHEGIARLIRRGRLQPLPMGAV